MRSVRREKPDTRVDHDPMLSLQRESGRARFRNALVMLRRVRLPIAEEGVVRPHA